MATDGQNFKPFLTRRPYTVRDARAQINLRLTQQRNHAKMRIACVQALKGLVNQDHHRGGRKILTPKEDELIRQISFLAGLILEEWDETSVLELNNLKPVSAKGKTNEQSS